MTMASRIGVMGCRRLEQVATPPSLRAPTSRWIAEFVGDFNMSRDRSGRAMPSPADFDTGRRNDHGRRARQPITKTVVASRSARKRSSCRGAARCRRGQCAVNHRWRRCDRCPVFGGITTYKVKLDSGAVLRSSMANTARIDIDAYNANQRVVACSPRTIAWCWSNERRRIFTRRRGWPRSRPICGWLLFFLVPFGFLLKISLSQTAIAQPPYLPVLI